MSQYYEDEFKLKIVELYNQGRKVGDLCKDYQVSTTSVRDWIKRYNIYGKFSSNGILSLEEKRIKELEKENRWLLKENEILKEAMLIVGKKKSK
jgi:transposase